VRTCREASERFNSEACRSVDIATAFSNVTCIFTALELVRRMGIILLQWQRALIRLSSLAIKNKLCLRNHCEGRAARVARGGCSAKLVVTKKLKDRGQCRPTRHNDERNNTRYRADRPVAVLYFKWRCLLSSPRRAQTGTDSFFLKVEKAYCSFTWLADNEELFILVLPRTTREHDARSPCHEMRQKRQ
jgi:hypothetical protein